MDSMEEDEQLEEEVDLQPDMEVDESEDDSETRSELGQSFSSSKLNTEDGMTMPIFANGRYMNPWKSWQRPKLTNLFKLYFYTKDKSKIPGKLVCLVNN
ncbi:hypothetical protein PoB_007143300 [Plakobranchus ocellatus]|uniref:Uncharacterized protein n=1 Tax=Plakobranchus ocellatus TaxID=259542 RepID=A0AAV4DKW1_9GAST|nr:hypothetical protein PoB_007143300 [Plakobranchus ocellatus]